MEGIETKDPENITPGALFQAFYLSPQFRKLSIETRDYRWHPVLGGISSTRWSCYDSFRFANGRLVSQLAERAKAATAIQLTGESSATAPELVPAEAGLSRLRGNHGSLPKAGLLSGNAQTNRLGGSAGADVLMGWQGDDRLEGGAGDDLLSGGPGRDQFVFAASTNHANEFDEITDFDGRRGDRIRIQGARNLLTQGSDFRGRRGDVVSALWMAKIDPRVPGSDQPWMTHGIHLSVDSDGDRNPDLTISLPGVMAVKRAWLLLD